MLRVVQHHVGPVRIAQHKVSIAVTNEILGDLVRACAPRFMRLTAEFNVRGGIGTTVVAEHRADGWQAPEAVELP